MIGLGWIMMYNSMVEKRVDNNNIMNSLNNEKNELKNNIIVANKI